MLRWCYLPAAAAVCVPSWPPRLLAVIPKADPPRLYAVAAKVVELDTDSAGSMTNMQDMFVKVRSCNSLRQRQACAACYRWCNHAPC